MEPYSERAVLALALVNIALQLFDGVATWVGIRAGVAEGNPLLGKALATLGPASALCLFKIEACACVLLLWRLRRHPLAVPALVVTATVYAACSLAPWTRLLAGRLL
jgi:hypothetical protein